MSTSLIPLHDVNHRALKVKNNATFAQANKQHLIPIAVSEVVDAATEFPVVFVKNADTGEFTLVVLMGLAAQSNLYCGKDYTANYAPLSLRLYPFALHLKEGTQQMEVCVRNDERLLSENTGNALFTEEGEQTEYLKQQTALLLQYDEQLQMTKAFTQLLLENDLLKAQSVKINIADAQAIQFDGIYTVDEEKLRAMPDDFWLSLRQSGALQVIHAHLASLKQLNRLARMTAKQAELG